MEGGPRAWAWPDPVPGVGHEERKEFRKRQRPRTFPSKPGELQSQLPNFPDPAQSEKAGTPCSKSRKITSKGTIFYHSFFISCNTHLKGTEKSTSLVWESRISYNSYFRTYTRRRDVFLSGQRKPCTKPTQLLVFSFIDAHTFYAFVSGTSALTGRGQRAGSLSPRSVRVQQKTAITGKRALIRARPRWRQDRGLPASRTEKSMSVVDKPPGLWRVTIATRAD